MSSSSSLPMRARSCSCDSSSFRLMPEIASSICLRREISLAKIRIPPTIPLGILQWESPNKPTQFRFYDPSGLRLLVRLLRQDHDGAIFRPVGNVRKKLVVRVSHNLRSIYSIISTPALAHLQIAHLPVEHRQSSWHVLDEYFQQYLLRSKHSCLSF